MKLLRTNKEPHDHSLRLVESRGRAAMRTTGKCSGKSRLGPVRALVRALVRAAIDCYSPLYAPLDSLCCRNDPARGGSRRKNPDYP